MSLLYRCDACGKTADRLSDSWSEIAIMSAESAEPVALLHHCLECRSVKREAR